MASAAPTTVFVGTSPSVAQVDSIAESTAFNAAYTAPYAYTAAPHTYAASPQYAYAGSPAAYTNAAGFAAPFAYNAAYNVS